MLVFELPLQICFLIPMPSECVSEKIARLLDAVLQKEEFFPGVRGFLENAAAEAEDGDFASKNEGRPSFRPYTFDQPYPLEAERVYCTGKVYTVRIRTISQELAEFFSRMLPLCRSDCLQVLGGGLRLIPRGALERVHTLTPVVVKTGYGYWRNRMQVDEYEERLKTNLIRKYNFFCHTNLSGNFSLFKNIEFINRKPVRVSQSNVSLRGDKVSLTAACNSMAQELLYMALGTGVGENNARGCGFLGYRFR